MLCPSIVYRENVSQIATLLEFCDCPWLCLAIILLWLSGMAHAWWPASSQGSWIRDSKQIPRRPFCQALGILAKTGFRMLIL